MEKENSLNEDQLQEPDERIQLECHHPDPKLPSGREFDGTIRSIHRSLTLKFKERAVFVKGTVKSDRKHCFGLIRFLGEGLKWFRGRIFNKSRKDIFSKSS